ncbi:MAG: M48 family metalloprotease, partial [Chloroflexi bacterium]|nr:M48 family metalloprotease [Chloroflexota bacterium]
MTFGNTLKTVALLAALSAILILAGRLVAGPSGMVIALGLSFVMNFGAYWFSDKLALAMSRAREVTPQEAPELHRVVAQLAQFAQVPMPRVYVVDDPSPNAFATGRDPAHAAVAVTTGILRILNWDELSGVLAHELGHVKNRDTLISAVAASVAGAITYLAHMAQWA